MIQRFIETRAHAATYATWVRGKSPLRRLELRAARLSTFPEPGPGCPEHITKKAPSLIPYYPSVMMPSVMRTTSGNKTVNNRIVHRVRSIARRSYLVVGNTRLSCLVVHVPHSIHTQFGSTGAVTSLVARWGIGQKSWLWCAHYGRR